MTATATMKEVEAVELAEVLHTSTATVPTTIYIIRYK